MIGTADIGVVTEVNDSLYKQFVEFMPILCVDIIVHRGKDFLLIKRSDEPAKDEWWFPGGRVLKGESLHKAARRKVMGETGLDVNIERIVGVYETMFFTSPFQIPIHTVNVTLLAGIIGDFNVVLDHTSSDYRVANTTKGCNDYIARAVRESGILEE